MQDFVQAGGQDRNFVFCKFFIISELWIFVKGFESPWGYFIAIGYTLSNFHPGYSRLKHHFTVNNPLDVRAVLSTCDSCEMAEQI